MKKAARWRRKSVIRLVGVRGFEPPTLEKQRLSLRVDKHQNHPTDTSTEKRTRRLLLRVRRACAVAGRQAFNAAAPAALPPASPA
jgi:hypothetical protein